MKKLGVAPWSAGSVESTDSASLSSASSSKKKKMTKKDQQATATARCHAMVALASMAAAAAEDSKCIGDDEDAAAVADAFAANEEEATRRPTEAGVDLNEKLAAADSVTTGNPGNANDVVSSKSIIPKENDCAAMIAAEAMSALFAGQGTVKREEVKDQSETQTSSKVEKDTSASSAPSTPSRKKGLSHASTNSPSRQAKKQKTGGEVGTANPPKKGRVVVRGSGRAGPKNTVVAHPIPPHAGHYNWTGAGNPYLPNQHNPHHAGYAHAHAAYSQYPSQPLPPQPTEGQYAAASSTNANAGVPTTSAAPASYPVSYSYPYYPPQTGTASVPDTSPPSESNASKPGDTKTGDASTAKPQQSQSSASASSYPPHPYNHQQQYPPSHAYYYHHHPSHALHHHYFTAAAPHHQHYQQQQQQQQWAPAQPPRRG